MDLPTGRCKQHLQALRSGPITADTEQAPSALGLPVVTTKLEVEPTAAQAPKKVVILVGQRPLDERRRSRAQQARERISGLGQTHLPRRTHAAGE